MPELNIIDWQLKFEADAAADDYAIFREHLRSLGLPEEPTSMVKSTILMVQACAAYAELDGQSLDRFLRMQTYDPSRSEKGGYIFTFDVHGRTFARLLVDPAISIVDLADLYGHPWMDHQVAGYNRLWISRTDGADLTKTEMRSIEREVAQDLRFHYGEDDVEIMFNESLSPRYLFVYVQDRHHPAGRI